MGRLLDIAKAALAVAIPCPIPEPEPVSPLRMATPIPKDWVAIPGSSFPIDPLYRGVIDGRRWPGWTLEGQIAKRRDQMRRTDDPVIRARLQADIEAILADEGMKKGP